MEAATLDAVEELEASSETQSQGAETAPSRTPILYLNHSAQISGAESSLRSLLWAMRRADMPFEPIIALPDGGPFSGLLRDEGWNVTLAPLRRLHRPRGLIDGMSSLLHVLQTLPHISRLVQQTGAKIVHSNSTTAHLVGGVAGERTGRPTIWHCRDLVPLARLAPQLAAKATRVIAISGCVAELLEKEGVPHDKIVRVPNGIDTDEWRPKQRSLLRESLGWSEDAFVFGMIGQLVPWKNHAAFVEAAAQIVDEEGCEHARFAIIGGDLWGEQAPYVQELRALVKKHNLVERFNFIPHQSDGVDAMSAINALVHPAHDEPFGRVIMEAMALNKPAIAMNINGPCEIINHEHDGLLVSPDDENGLANAMKRVVREAELRAHLSQNARRSIESNFHIADHASKIAEIYHDLGV
ncbi:MAG TPA: glycosyltransferase family 4 protein [Abditibacterium sp.]|jgi:glycosyltransferase involved in cell wall biosynthesis